MRWRKKPVVVVAERVSVLLADAARCWSDLPEWFRAAYESGGLLLTSHAIYVRTLEGRMVAGRDDWLIRGVKGELYPCKDEIFRETYELVE
jgi:hypothetical protein